MWWSMPETEARAPGGGARRLALAGTIERQQRTVLTSLALADVQPNPDHPRKHFAPDKLAELADSIKARGLLQPIIVRRVESGYQLLAGERRFRAAQLAGLDKLPALIRTDDDPLEVARIESLQRGDRSPLEEAEGLALLIERHGYSHREVAELLGKSRPYVSNTLALTRLPEAVKADLCRDGPAVSRELLMGVARQEDPDAALALWRRLQLDLLSVRRFRAEKEGTASERPVVLEVLTAARRLNRTLVRLIAEGAPTAQGPRLVRTLRRTGRLVERQLAALAAVTEGDSP